MANWQTRDRKRNHKHKDKQYKKFYGQTKAESKIEKNLIREQRRLIEAEQGDNEIDSNA